MKIPVTKKNNQFYLNASGVKGKEVPFNVDSVKSWSPEFKRNFLALSEEFQTSYLSVTFLIAVHEFKSNEDPLDYENGMMEIIAEEFPNEIEMLNKAHNESINSIKNYGNKS